jgi:hypothetical protein
MTEVEKSLVADRRLAEAMLSGEAPGRMTEVEKSLVAVFTSCLARLQVTHLQIDALLAGAQAQKPLRWPAGARIEGPFHAVPPCPVILLALLSRELWIYGAWALSPAQHACIISVALRLGLSGRINMLPAELPRSALGDVFSVEDCVKCPPLMEALLDVPGCDSGFDVNHPAHADVVLSAAAKVLCGNSRWGASLCMRLLGLTRADVLHDRHGPLVGTLIWISTHGHGLVCDVICVLCECVKRAEVDGDGVDLTATSEDCEVSPLARLEGQASDDSVLSARLSSESGLGAHAALRYEFRTALQRIGRYRRGGVQSAIAEALRPADLHQRELIGLMARFLIVPIAHEEFLNEVLDPAPGAIRRGCDGSLAIVDSARRSV